MKMRKTLFLFLFLASCRDQYAVEFDPYGASQIEGLWRAEAHPYWTYHFSDGVFTQTIYDFNTPLIERYWAFKTRNDSIFCEDLTTPNVFRTYKVFFNTDSTATLTDISGVLQVGQQIKRF